MFPPLLFLFLAQAPPNGTLELHLTTGGMSTAARVYLTDASGQRHLVPGAVTYTRREESHSVVDGDADIGLASGTYKIRAEKGAEYRSAEKTVEIGSGARTRVSLDIPRFYNMNDRGWYSGDLHIHRSPVELPLLARAEDLNIAPTITRHLGGTRRGEEPFPAIHLAPVDSMHIVSLQNQEVERLVKGHGAIVLVNVPRPIDGRMSTLFPLELDYCRQARSQGGFVDAEKPIWKNVPINIAFNAIDSIGVVNNHFHPSGVLLDTEKYGAMERDKPGDRSIAGFAQWMMDLYWSFLNCGFRIPVSAGSASGVMPSWPGYERVYVHIDGPFSYEQWFRNLKAGQSVATNGPLLIASVNGKLPGAEIAWDKPAAVKLAIEVYSQGSLDRVEVIYNGKVLRVFPVMGKGDFRKTMDLPIVQPGWLAVRCFEVVKFYR